MALTHDQMHHLAHGLMDKEISAELIISVATVRTHVRNIFAKTGCANRTEAAAYATATGLAQGAPPATPSS